MSLTFDQSTHEYRYNDQLIPSVTQVIGSAGLSDFSNVPIDVLDYAAHRGTLVHKLAEAHDKNEFIHVDEGDDALQFFDSYCKFLEHSNPKIIEVEKPLASKKLWFAGTLDRVIKLNDEPFILDIKTGSRTPAHQIQMAAYRELWQENFGEKLGVMALYLTPKNYSLQDFSETVDHDINLFFSALALYNFKIKNRLTI